MKYLIAGKQGQLARAFIERFERLSLNFIAPDESELDITNQQLVRNVVAAHKPDVIINCAAYNLVDNAEQEKETAFAVNAAGPGYLANAASEHKAFLVHFGSDYVFDGLKENGLYCENDPVNPMNEYGKSKLSGEQQVAQECEKHLIFRLSWLFGKGGRNFISKVIEWSERSEYLKIACDEFSAPTSTETVVEVTLKALDQGVIGLYHLPNSGYCSRYEWAKLVLNTRGITKFIRPVGMDSFRMPAKRPLFSAMSNAAISKALNISIPSWEHAVSAYLQGYPYEHAK